MGSKEFRALKWVVFALSSLLFVPESQGYSSQSSLVTTLNFESSPAISPELPSLPLSSPPEANKDVRKKFFPGPASSPTLNSEPTNNQSSSIPVNAPSKGVDKIISPATTPTPPEAKQASNFSSGSSPSISPESNKKTPSNAHALSVSPPSINPEPHKENLNPTSDITLAPSPSSIESRNSSNSNTLAPFPSNSKPFIASPHISPASHEADEPSNATHSPSPSSIEAQNSSNANTLAPFPSNPKPLVASPQISPTSHEANKPSNATRSPLPTIPSPAKSPVSHEEANSSIIMHAPSTSHPKIFKLSPTLSPSTNTKSSLPLVSSPTISPTSHEIITPSNITHAPLPSSMSPVISSIPREVNTHSPKSSPSLHISPSTSLPSNDTHSPLPTIPSPAKSPVSHEEANSSIITHAPSTSHPKIFKLSPTLSPSTNTKSSIPLVSSPTISPTSHEIITPSNITHAPLPSSMSPVISSIPREVNTHSPKSSPSLHISPSTSLPSNDTISPLPSHDSPPSLHISPSTSLPSNDTISPLPSHIHPSLSTPMASPTPREVKQPSNITHSPLPSLSPNPLETSPAISPIPHLVTVPPNTTHVSPLLSPMPHGLNNATNTTHEMAPVTSKPKHDALAPLSHSPQSSKRQGTVSPPSMSHIPAVPPGSNESKHAPSPHMHVPSIAPVEAPLNLPVPPKDDHTDHPLSPTSQDHSISPMQTPFPSPHREVAFAPSPSKVIPSWHNKSSVHHPVLPPPPQIIWALPPPPPNLDCKFLTCQENVTYPPPGSLCVCVMPIKVELRLGISLYTFFPLVTELAQEIASGVFVKQSQVRVMGANADAEDPGKTILLIDLVPLGKSFDINTALLVYARFWHKQLLIKDSYFGEYDVLYVDYPGLPPSPPVAPGYDSVDGGSLTNGNARAIKPIGVDVKQKKGEISGTLIAIIILSSVIALVIIVGTAWILLLRCRNSCFQPSLSSHQSLLPLSKPLGSGPTMIGSGRSSTSASLTSSIAAGSAKTFSLAEMERATNNFHELRIIGEGGFGRVYQGTLEDGTLVAVKMLKRDDHQGGREFAAEIEMLSRLHHRNLVKLIGICIEEVRCLVYELIPNGSVESHLHGLDRTTSPLDWNARIKIALGAARGLAYLHEDSSPRVIHRDFKSSNILLEHDYTPKVSDFGLARVALGEGNDHISTCVMGTFGYVAPEYAMTGHLLVKSDVYSYGVVLLELLTGRKPVDMSQPPGQETLVNWARPLLTSTQGLEILIDPSISANVSLDTVAKVAAIASMCVQPEVSNRPYMGEVVQALKLVCDETHEELSNKEITDVRNVSREIFGENNASGSFRKGFSSGPIKMGRSDNEWENVREFSSGSMIKNGDQMALNGFP